jgi:hypothetical protein
MAIDAGRYSSITSFLDLYTQEKDFQHISLGRSGATNFLIRLQIEEVIKQSADYAIIGTTSNDRIDLAIDRTSFPITLQHVDYTNYGSDSGNYIINQNPSVISDSISNWTEGNYELNVHQNRDRKISQQSIEAMKHYVAYLHDTNLSIMQDYYMIAEGLRKLISLNKQFILIPSSSMAQCDWSFIGDRLWTGKLPWAMPYGFEPTTINHNPQVAHDYFAKQLLEMTAEWK